MDRSKNSNKSGSTCIFLYAFYFSLEKKLEMAFMCYHRGCCSEICLEYRIQRRSRYVSPEPCIVRISDLYWCTKLFLNKTQAYR